MLDAILKPHLLPHLDKAAEKAAQGGLSANKLTLIAFAIGLTGCFFAAMQIYMLGLIFILLNRALNGIAGALARRAGPTDLGIMLDTLCDFIFFASFVFFFTLSAEGTSLAAAFLLFSYLVMGMTYLSHAAAGATRGNPRPRGGIIENAEMTAFMILCCVYPAGFAAFAALFGLICLASAVLRFAAALKTLRS